MDKLTAIKIKYDDETYSDEIPIRVLSENVEWDNTHTLVDVLGSIDVDAAGTIQDQISQLFNEKVSATQLQDYVASQLNDIGANPVVVDSSLTISGAAADAKIVGDNINDLKSAMNDLYEKGTLTASESGSKYIPFHIVAGHKYRFVVTSTENTDVSLITSDHQYQQGLTVNAGENVEAFITADDSYSYSEINCYFRAAGTVIVEDVSLKIPQIESEIDLLQEDSQKLHEVVEGIERCETVTAESSGNKYVTFNFELSGKYKLTNNSSGNISARTETASGATVQTLANVSPGSFLVFTATDTADRILIYFRGAGTAKIENIETFVYQTKEQIKGKADAVVDSVGDSPIFVKLGTDATINSSDGRSANVTFGYFGNALGFKSDGIKTSVGKRFAVWAVTDCEESLKLSVIKTDGKWGTQISMDYIPSFGHYGVIDIENTNNGNLYIIYASQNVPKTVDISVYAFDVTDNANLEAVIQQEGGFNLVGIHANSFDRFGKAFGKIINYFGDSNTANKRYQTFANRQNGVINSYTSGVGGSNVAGGLADAFWQDARINTLHDDADIIYIMGGTNDSANGRNIGDVTLANHTTTTFIGAYNVVISKIYYKFLNDTTGYYSDDGVDYSGVTRATNKKQIMIVLGTPPFTSDSTYTNNGKMQEIIEAVKQVGNMWGLPVVNVWGEANLNAINYPDYYSDTVHVNVKGGQRIGNIIGKRINEVLR